MNLQAFRYLLALDAHGGFHRAARACHVSQPKLSIQISTDLLGDNIIIPSSEATLSTGVTTATVGAAVYDLAIDYGSASDQIYIWYKTDAGTVTVDSVDVSWRE